MDSKNKKISKILDKYKSSFSSTDLSNLESLLSNDSLVNEEYLLFTDGACEFDNEYVDKSLERLEKLAGIKVKEGGDNE